MTLRDCRAADQAPLAITADMLTEEVLAANRALAGRRAATAALASEAEAAEGEKAKVEVDGDAEKVNIDTPAGKIAIDGKAGTVTVIDADKLEIRARVEAAEGALLSAQENYENTLVRAPFAGIVVERHVELGEMATVGTPLMTGLSLEHLRVVVDVPQSDIGALRGGGEAWVELPDGDSLPAEQIRIFPYADPATHTFRVRMRLAAGHHGIYPGMWVKVSFHTGEDQVLPVPATAVITRSELTAVYVMGNDGAPRLRQVRLGRELPDGRIAVLAGLDPGERVVTDGDAARRALLDERR